MENYLSEKHKKDLEGSGLNEEIINQSNVFTCDAVNANRLLDRKDIGCECLVFPYPSSNGAGKDFFRLKPDGIILNGTGKPAKYLQKYSTEVGESRLYIHPKVKENLTVEKTEYADLPIIITEGEKKTLKLTQDFFLDEKKFLPIGLSGVWQFCYTKQIRDKEGNVTKTKVLISDFDDIDINDHEIYICFDSNITFNKNVWEAADYLSGQLLVKGASIVKRIHIPHEESYGTHGVGVDDYLISHTKKDFLDLVENAESQSSIRWTIEFTRKLPKLTQLQKLNVIVQLICKDKAANGSYFFDTNGSYYFINRTKKLLSIESDEFARIVANDYGLYREMGEFKNIMSKLDEYAYFHGRKVTIKNFSYFNKDKKQVSVYDNNGSMYNISNGVEVTKEHNGYEDIFFKHRSDVEPFTYYPNSVGYWDQYIIPICNFRDTEYTKLTPSQQKFLLTVYFYSLFFPNLMPTKPVLVMTGDWQSGKSTIQRIIGKLLFGKDWNVSTLGNERDFLTSIINKYYLVYDNADIDINWVRNAIASLATGMKVETRRLYSNMEMFSADPIAYLGLNSMTQSLYKRADVASRLLIFRTKRLEGELIPEEVLNERILNVRDFLLSEIFDNLAKIANYVDDKFTYKGAFRMADFANIGFKIAIAFGRENEFKHILEIMTYDQQSLPMEDNPLIDLLDHWLNKRLVDEPIASSELYGQLKDISDTTKMYFPFKSSVSFGRDLQTSIESLKQLYDIKSFKGRSNKTLWRISFKKGELNDGTDN